MEQGLGRQATIGIGELSARTGTSVRALRYYEQHRLLQATRTASGHRRFGQDAVTVVQRIRMLLDAGLPLKTVGSVLVCFEGGTALHPCVTTYLRDHEAVITTRVAALERQGEALRHVQSLVSSSPA
ncbi:DNA-binding transcriptional MerR regulator [Microbacterium resistens]|uniref:DNA-binding transcriptional MerR regulator n=1 Tax=Microbacterium resistens TaxID=156977 RepID=A0ABU1SBN1_9MICO|nr:MerR family transcriptional regulator [Microbacterium resistens]MDR6866996.1 DNA-binding transcriptional MerR regulator [Microbacterium resistens]